MTHDRALIDAFLDELARWRLTDTSPSMYDVVRRMTLSDMILTELADDNLEHCALRDLAAAALDVCLWPADIPTAAAYIARRRAHAEAFVACWPL